jgi:hypothetical protein
MMGSSVAVNPGQPSESRRFLPKILPEILHLSIAILTAAQLPGGSNYLVQKTQ